MRIADPTNPGLATALNEALAFRRQSTISNERRQAVTPEVAVEAPGTVQRHRIERDRDDLNLRYADYLERQNLRDEGTTQAGKADDKPSSRDGDKDRFVRLVPALAELPKDTHAAAAAKTAMVRQAYRVEELVVPGRFVDRLV